MHTETANHANDPRSPHHGPSQAFSAAPDGVRRNPIRTNGGQPAPAPLPIWFAALVASNCQASGDGGDHVIHWMCESGRAVYRNDGAHAEWIEPLNIRLHGGSAVSVTWIPGDTAYTVEVLHTLDCVA